MDKILKMGWSDIIKIVLIIGSVATAWGIQQAKISNLEKGRDENRHNIELLSERMRILEINISSINSKTDLINENVVEIRNFLLNNNNGY